MLKAPAEPGEEGPLETCQLSPQAMATLWGMDADVKKATADSKAKLQTAASSTKRGAVPGADASQGAALGIPKAALMFLTRGDMPLEPVWRLWLESAAGRGWPHAAIPPPPPPPTSSSSAIRP